jgi:sugar/nucleoside kinase (ribokinase family)
VADLEQILTFAARCAAITVSRRADPPLRASVVEAIAT